MKGRRGKTTAELSWKNAGLLESVVCQGPKAMPTDSERYAAELMPFSRLDKPLQAQKPKESLSRSGAAGSLLHPSFQCYLAPG